MIDSYLNNIIIRRRMGLLNGKKLNIKPIRFGKGNYLRTFSNATSLHAVIYLGEPNRPFFERIFWVCVTLLVFLMCGFQIKQLHNNWMESDIITILSESNSYLAPSDDVPFAGITICSDLQLKNLENMTVKDKLLNKEFEDSINIMCHIKPNQPDLDVGLNYIEPKTWDLLLNNYRTFCYDRLISITWIQDKIDDPCQYFQPVYTVYGICYSMNMIPFSQLLNNGYNQVLSNLNHFKADIITKPNETMWHPERGFDKNAKPFHLPWKVIGDTVADSVTMTLSLKKDNFGKHCPKTDSGMTLIVHSPIDMPAIVHPTAYIAVNNIAHVTTSYTLRTTSSSLSRWKPNIRHCYYQHERTLKFFNIYTINNCEIECRANHSLKMCGCVAYYYPRDTETPICGSASYKCMQQYANNGYSVFSKHLIDLNSTDDCNCLDVCTELRYQHNIVYTHKNLSRSNTNSNKQNQEKSIVVMYYKRKPWSVHRSALIPVNEFLGNIGGSLGLFLGASIISVFEIIYFFVIRLYVDRWNKKEKNKKNDIKKY